jgi:hypothetical protein
MYRLAAPPAGVDRDVIDKLWDPVESRSPDLIRRLEEPLAHFLERSLDAPRVSYWVAAARLGT